jgi:hypothetical protein
VEENNLQLIFAEPEIPLSLSIYLDDSLVEVREPHLVLSSDNGTIVPNLIPGMEREATLVVGIQNTGDATGDTGIIIPTAFYRPFTDSSSKDGSLWITNACDNAFSVISIVCSPEIGLNSDTMMTLILSNSTQNASFIAYGSIGVYGQFSCNMTAATSKYDFWTDDGKTIEKTDHFVIELENGYFIKEIDAYHDGIASLSLPSPCSKCSVITQTFPHFPCSC